MISSNQKSYFYFLGKFKTNVIKKMKMKQPVVSRKFIQILTNTDQLTTRSPPYWKYQYQNAMRPECAQGLATEFRLNSYSGKITWPPGDKKFLFYPYKKCPSAH